MSRIKKIAGTLIDYIYEESGIKLTASDLILNRGKTGIKVLVYNFDLVDVSFDKEEWQEFEPEDFAVKILEQAGDIKRALTRLLIQSIEKYLPNLVTELQKRVSGHPGQTEWDEFFFSIEDRGYNYTHFCQGEEAESGYPVIVLRIRTEKGMDMDWPVNIYYPETPIDDMELLVAEIIRNSTA